MATLTSFYKYQSTIVLGAAGELKFEYAPSPNLVDDNTCHKERRSVNVVRVYVVEGGRHTMMTKPQSRYCETFPGRGKICRLDR